MRVIARAVQVLDRWPVSWPIGTACLAFAAGSLPLLPPGAWVYRAFVGPINVDFTIAIWHLSWLRNGFVKRGLPGTIADLLGSTPNPTVLWATHLLALAAAAIVIGLIGAHATRRFPPAKRMFILFLLALSPALLWHAGRDVGRLTAVLLLALFAGARLLASGYTLSAALLVFAAGLVHEVVVLVGGALFGVITLDRMIHHRPFTLTEWVRNALAAGILFALLVACFTFKPTGLAQSYLSAAPFVQERTVLSNALLWFNADVTMNIGENVCYFRNYPLRWAYVALTVAFIAVHAPALFAPLGRPRLALAGLLAAGFAPLAVLAIDMGRWAALVIAAMWAYFLAVVAAQKQPRLHLARPAVVALAACYLLGPLTVSGTLAVPHMMHYLLRLPPQTAVWPICHPRFPDIMLAP